MISGTNSQTGTTYTIQPSDATKLVTFTNPSAVAVTLPPSSTIGYGAGRQFSVQNLGPSVVTITCACMIYSQLGLLGSPTLTLAIGQGADIYSNSNGVDYSAFLGGSGGGGGGGSGTVTAVGLTTTGSVLCITNTPITISGNINIAICPTTQNLFLASPNGASGTPTMRAFVAADLPLSFNAPTATSLFTTPTLCPTGQAPVGVLANGNVTGCAPLGGGGGPGTGTLYAMPYWATTTSLGSISGIAGQTLLFEGTSAPIAAAQGIVGRTKISGSTDLILCDSGTAQLDRGKRVIYATNGTVTVTIPDAGSTGCGGNFFFGITVGDANVSGTNYTASTTLTINNTSTSKFYPVNGGVTASAETTFQMSTGQYATFFSPDNVNWQVQIVPGPSILDVGPTSLIAGTGLDGRINTACLASYAGPGTVPVLDARGYPAGSSVLMLTNPFDNCNKTFKLLLGPAIYIQCVPWITPHVPHSIEGMGISQAVNPLTGTVIRAGTTADGCPTNFPGASGAVINWTASGFLGAVFGHGPWNWYTTTGGFNNSGTTVVAQIYPGAMTASAGANSLDWTVNTFGFQLSHLTLNGNGLANFGIFTASEEEHSELDDVIFNGQGLGNGITVTSVTNGSATVPGTFPYPKLLTGNLIYLNGTPAVVSSATTSALTLVGTFSGGTSSSVTFAWAGATAQAVFDRMSNNGCAGTIVASGGVTTCTSTGAGGSPTQSGPGNTYIHAIQSAQNAAYAGVKNGTPYGLVYVGYGIEIYIWDASGSGTGARAFTTVATGATLTAPVVSYQGSGYAAAGGGGTQCAVYSPMANQSAGLTCTPTVSGGAVTAITLGGTNSFWAVGANAVTGPVIVGGGWGEAGNGDNNPSDKPSFADEYYIAGVTSMTLLGKQCQGLYGTAAAGPLGSSCVHIGDGSGYTYGGFVAGVQAANEYAASGSPASVHIGADIDQGLSLFNINQQANSGGRPIILDDRFVPAVSLNSTTACEGVAEYTYSHYDACGILNAGGTQFGTYEGGSVGIGTVAPASTDIRLMVGQQSDTTNNLAQVQCASTQFCGFRINWGGTIAYWELGSNYLTTSTPAGVGQVFSANGSTRLQISTTGAITFPNFVSMVLPSGTTGTTQTVGDTSTDLATDQFVSQNAIPTAVLMGGASVNTPTGTQYIPVSGRTSINTAVLGQSFVTPRAMTFTGITVALGAAEGASATLSFTLVQCTTAGCGTVNTTALTCTVGNSASTCTGTGSVAILTGIPIAIQTVQTGTGTNAVQSVSLTYQ